ncbi:MAG: hypothetical protein WAU53_07650 [Rhodoplanes sp.]
MAKKDSLDYYYSLCPSCARDIDESMHVLGPNLNGRGLIIEEIKRKDGGFEIAGRLERAVCPFCGIAIREIGFAVPVEMQHLTCECKSKDFDFALRSVKEDTGKQRDWRFELDVNCRQCHRTKFSKLVTSLLGIKRIKVGVSGIELQMK